MKADKEKRSFNTKYISGIAAIVIVLVLAAVLVARAVSGSIVNENIGIISEIAEHDKHAVLNSLNLRYEVLEGIEKSLENAKAEDIQAAQTLLQDRLASVPGAKELSLVDDKGTVYKNNGLAAYLAEVDALCSAHDGRFAVRYNRPDSVMEMRRELLLFAVPADFSIGGVHFRNLVATMNIETLAGELKIDSYSGQGYSSIVDEDGNYIVNVSKSHNFLTYDNFFEDMEGAAIRGHDSAAAVLAEARETGSCTDVYTLDGQESIAVVSDVEDTDWYLVSVVPLKVFAETTQSIMGVTYALLGAVAAVVAAVLLLMARSRRQRGELAYAAERTKHLETIEEQHEALNNALAQAESANRAKTAFLFNMSHDIRTPMNAIIGFNNMALSHIDEKDTVVNSLKKVGTSSRQLLSLINDVLDMSRIESGAVKCEFEPADLVESGSELMEIIKQSTDKKLDYEFDFSGIEHKYALADHLHLNRIFTNVLSNSVKYTPEGGKISFTAKETPASRENAYGYDFVIEDNGIGMSEEFLEHIFEEFAREKTSTVSGIQGTGLGMAITKRLIDLLGGTIAIQSKLGEGTKTTIHLEMEGADPNAVSSESALLDAEIDVNLLKGKKVLLVEDNELNREIAEDILTEEGMLVDTAEDGDIAVEKMRNAEVGQYDIILMDIQMPRMNGYEATKAIRNLPGTYASTIPIVAMTANAFEEDKQNAINAGMNGHLAKPIEIRKLLAMLGKFI